MNLLDAVAVRAGNRCEYCRMHQALQGATFHVEHILPRVLGGDSELANLAWACPSCNLMKGSRVGVLDEQSGVIVPLFNPRLHEWRQHFTWQSERIAGVTDIGRMTVETL